jgi:hypothetical protein
MEPVLTVRQPWACAIFRAGKDVENRGRPTNYRGRLWIHAGLSTDRQKADKWATKHDIWLPEEPLPRGYILGSVELEDCAEESRSIWAIDDNYFWVLSNPRVLHHPVRHTGQLGFAWRNPPKGKTTKAKRDPRSH